MLPEQNCNTVLYIVQTVLLGAVRSHVLARPAARQSFSYKWGVAGWGEIICLCLTGVL
jgi:hypothetical protein